MSSQFGLMKERRFRPFFFTQFLGAFNDNVFKTALVTLVTFRAGELTTIKGSILATLLPGLFILPFFLFSATSGQLADKLDKDKIARAVKVFEIGIMLLAAYGFMLHLLWPLVLALFLMGVHSTLFGPVKYSYLPQHLQSHELMGGNGMVEMGTFVAILTGQILGAYLVSINDDLVLSVSVIAIAVFGWWTSRGIPATPAGDPALKLNYNLFTATWHSLKFARSTPIVWLAILAISWFWFYGATVLAQFPTYAREVLHGSETTFMVMLTFFSLGVGVGSLLCEKLSRGKVEMGLVPLGALGLVIFGVDLYFATPSPGAPLPTSIWPPLRILIDIVLLGVAGGIYIVPLYALLQTRCEKAYQSRVIGANNIVNAAFMVLSAVVSMVLLQAGFSIAQLFLCTALVTLVVMAGICWREPEFLRATQAWLRGSTPD